MMTGRTLTAVQQLRRELTRTAEACDLVLYAQLWDQQRAAERLPRLLDRLIMRADHVKQQLMREEGWP
jgi:hypothetical protein